MSNGTPAAATSAAVDGGGHEAGEPQGSQAAWRRHHTVFTNAKGGMASVDMEHVQRVVYEMSKVARTSVLASCACRPVRARSRCTSAECTYPHHCCWPVIRCLVECCFDMQNSAHFRNEQRKQAQTEERIARLKRQGAALTQDQLAGHQRCACSLLLSRSSSNWLKLSVP